MTNSKRNWCLSVVKSIISQAAEVSSGTAFTHRVRTQRQHAKAIAGFCSGFAHVTYQVEAPAGFPNADSPATFVLTVVPH